MVKSFKILILNPAKAGRIRELKNISGRQGFIVLEEKNKGVCESLKFTLTTKKSQETIKVNDVKIFVPLMLKGKGCKVDEDYKLEIEE